MHTAYTYIGIYSTMHIFLAFLCAFFRTLPPPKKKLPHAHNFSPCLPCKFTSFVFLAKSYSPLQTRGTSNDALNPYGPKPQESREKWPPQKKHGSLRVLQTETKGKAGMAPHPLTPKKHVLFYGGFMFLENLKNLKNNKNNFQHPPH